MPGGRMSRTTTSTTSTKTSTISGSTSAIYLSPSKKRRTNDTAVVTNTLSEAVTPSGVEGRSAEDHPVASSGASAAEIYRWTFTKAAVASCFVNDIFNMRESGIRDLEYFWLGGIPCRTVRIVGLVVGVQVWEKRTVYTIDDGTAVVECAHAHAQTIPLGPINPKTNGKTSSKASRKPSGPSLADYLPPARTTVTSEATIVKRMALEPPPTPKPIARVGQSVRIIGRVVIRHGTRSLLVDEISRCASFSDEPAHWLAVSELHRTIYYPAKEPPAFIPPLLPSTSSNSTFLPNIPGYPGSPSRHTDTRHLREPGTPASVQSSQASTNTSPSTTVSGSSPTSDTNGKPQSPIRLRHPARLHTRDLTVHTLRIYIKHYMDNAPPLSRRHRRSSSTRSVSPSPSPRPSQTWRSAQETPTKIRRSRSTLGTDATPRCSRFRSSAQAVLPSAPTESDSEDEDEDKDSKEPMEDSDQVYGYTLSHLRRVSELALLAKRVVHAEAHRRTKEERRKAKAAAGHNQGRVQEKSTSASSAKPDNALPSDSDQKAFAAATKRLFRQAIRTLFQDGSIVLWDGPVRPLPAPALDPLLPSSFASALWKANTSASTSMGTSTSTSKSLSKSSKSFPSYDEWDEDAPLSEPAPSEEAYVPLTPTYFSRVLERAISRIMEEASHTSPTAAAVADSDATPKPASKARPKPMSLIERMRAQETETGSRVNAGPTAAELLAWLRNSDERWARVGLWSVEEALEWGRREGRVWCVGKGRWEVCG
ncbi:hypothetical protein C8Q78DRAFT_1084914 [Trametes maxima]|nr:hypothetical protein C8Q78DRAFT_1084914 [Trametes maxima]